MRRFCPFVVALVLAGCAGLTTSPLPTAAPDGPSKVGNKDAGTAVISIAIPTPAPKPAGMRPAYVSPSTKGMTISLTGPSALVKTIALRPQSRNCAGNEIGMLCSESIVLAPCPSKATCYRGSIATYDDVSCVRSVCTIPTGAHELSTNQDVVFSIAARRKTRDSARARRNSGIDRIDAGSAFDTVGKFEQRVHDIEMRDGRAGRNRGRRRCRRQSDRRPRCARLNVELERCNAFGGHTTAIRDAEHVWARSAVIAAVRDAPQILGASCS